MDSAILPDGLKYLAKANGIITTIWQLFEVVPATYWTHFRNDKKLTIHAQRRLLESNDAAFHRKTGRPKLPASDRQFALSGG